MQKLGESLCDGEKTGEFDKATATGMAVIYIIVEMVDYECYFVCLNGEQKGFFRGLYRWS